MQRFLREANGRTRQCTMSLDDRQVHTANGEIGRAPRKQSQTHPTSQIAARAWVEASQQMRDSGWSDAWTPPEPHIDPTIAPLLTQPSDPEPYLVLGDQLQSLGDPRGELIALQAADPFGTSADALLVESGLAPPEGARITWFCGFARTLTLRARSYAGDAAATLRSLVQTGSLAVLRELTVHEGEQLDAFVDAVSEHHWPVLTHLRVAASSPGTLSLPLHRVLTACPELRHLEVAHVRQDPQAIVHPALRTLILRGGDHLALSDALPALRRVEIHGYRGTDPHGTFKRALDRPLSHLELHGEAVERYLTDLDRPAHPPARLVLAPTSHGVLHLLSECRTSLRGVPIEMVGLDPTDEELRDLAPLDIETDLPDVAVRRDLSAVSAAQETERRFEKNGRFWSIVRDDARIDVHYGVVGKRGSRRQTPHTSPERAASDYRKRVRGKVASGWLERT